MKNGFTLIEMMIVVAIVAICAAVAIPAYQDYQTQKVCDRSPDSPACQKAKEKRASRRERETNCRAGYLFDSFSNKQIIGVNGGGVPCQ